MHTRKALLSLFLFVATQTQLLLAEEAKSSTSKAKSGDACEYEIDLKQNTVRAKCHGQPMGISIFTSNTSIKTSTPKASSMGADASYPSMDPWWEASRHPHWASSGSEANGTRNGTDPFSKIARKLSSEKSSIGNISILLSRGNSDLRSDLAALRGLNSDDLTVRESIIATMRNQYNFMQTAILAHNAELTRVLSLLESLVKLTSQRLHSCYQQQTQLQHQMTHLNRSVASLRISLSALQRKRTKHRSRRKDHCPRTVSAFGRGEAVDVSWERGVAMTDAGDGDGKIWVMTLDGGTDQLLQYNSREDARSNIVSRYYSLPFYCDGTGHVVHRHALYCHKSGTRVVTKYSLKRMEVVAEVELPSAGVDNTFPYQFQLNSDIDLAVDELGLWVVYSTKEAAGKMVVSKLDARSLAIEKTWLTSFPKKKVGNSFMVCGVLYATNSYRDTPTYIRFSYNTNDQSETVLEQGQLAFSNAVAGANRSSRPADSVMLDYNFRERRLYSWSHSQIHMFPVFFKKDAD